MVLYRLTGPWAAGLCAFALGCASTKEAELVVQPQATSSAVSAPALDLSMIDIVLKDRPKGFSLDGDIEEWGTLTAIPEQAVEPPVPQPSVEGAYLTPSFVDSESEAEAEPEVEPKAKLPAASHIAVTINRDGLLIAGRLKGAALRGFQLQLQSAMPTLPSVGNQFMPTGVAAGFDCKNSWSWGSDGAVLPGPPLSAADAEACVAKEQKGLAFEQAFYREFSRTLLVTANQAQVLGPNGEPIAGEARWSGTAGELSVELQLPLTVLPRLTQAPLQVLGLSAAIIGTAPEAAPALSWLALPTPLLLTPHEDLRALAFTPGPTRTSDPMWFYAPCLSYHPSKPELMRYVRHSDESSSELIQHEVPLYESLKQLGDVEIGFMAAPTSTIVVQKAGRPTQLVSPSPLGFMGLELPFQRRWMGERDGEFHILSFLPQDMSTGVAPVSAQWWLLRVLPDGSIKEEVLSPSSVASGFSYFVDYQERMSPNGDAFELIGNPVGGELPKGKALKASWKWNPKSHAYEAKAEPIKWTATAR